MLRIFFMLYSLAVSPLGSVVVQPARISVDFQETQVFVCTAQGGPNNEYEWLFDGTVISFTSTLTISSVDVSDGGVYTCTVRNPGGDDSESANLLVTPYNVIIRSPFTNQTVSLLETVNGMREVLTCEAQAFPSPTFSWMKLSGPGSPQTVSRNATLSFSPINFGDEGDYSCIADNGDQTNSAIVTVHGKTTTLFTMYSRCQGVDLSWQ